MSVTFNIAGNYVANEGSPTVASFVSATGAVNSVFGTSGVLTLTSSTGTPSPYGVAFDKSGNLYVTDSSNATVTSFNSTGAARNPVFGTNGLLALGPSSATSVPLGIAFDSSGNLYVADAQSGTVRSFNSTGTAPNSAFGAGGVLTLSSVSATPRPNTHGILTTNLMSPCYFAFH